MRGLQLLIHFTGHGAGRLPTAKIQHIFTPFVQYECRCLGINTFTFEISGNESDGQITFSRIWPLKQWQSFHWPGKSIETPSTDSVSIQIFGIQNNSIAIFTY